MPIYEHSAGAAGNFLAPITQLSANAFKSVIDIDVLGSYNTLKATLPHLIHSARAHHSDGLRPCSTGTGGRIIFVSATVHYTALPLQTHVAVAKAGVDALSNSTAIEFGPRGVTSNVISPGPIADTEGMARLARKEHIEAAQRTVPLGRYGRVKDIADATVYIFGDGGNFVNGQTLVGEFLPFLFHSIPSHPIPPIPLPTCISSRVRNQSGADKSAVQ